MAVNFTKPEINVREKLVELDKPSGIAGEAMLRAETPLDQNYLIGANLNNIIINGDFQIWQRGTSFSTGNKYTADRWYLYGNGSTNETITRETDVPEYSGASYSLRVTAGGAYGGGNYAMMRYTVASEDLMKLNTDTGSTLQFWVKADNPGIYTITFLQHRSSGSQRQISKTYRINYSDTWEFKVITIPSDSVIPYDSNSTYLSIDWVYGKNSNYSSGTFNDSTWKDNTNANRQPATQTNGMSAAGKKFSIAAVQYVPGQYPSGLPRLYRSYGEELALCQRYFQRLFDVSTASGIRWQGRIGSIYNATRCFVTVDLPVKMRVTPTISFNNFSWAMYSANTNIGPSSQISNTYPNTDSVGFDVYPAASGGVATSYFGNALHMDVNAGSCDASAEVA